MKKLNEKNLAYECKNFEDVCNLNLNNLTTYTLFVDAKCNQLCIGCKGRLTNSQFLVGKIRLHERTLPKMELEFHTKYKKLIRDYREKYIICKSTAIKRYGRKIVSKFAPFEVLDNPHYKCAKPMQLYDINIIERTKI